MLAYLLFYALVQSAHISGKTVTAVPLAASASKLSIPSTQPHNSIANSVKHENSTRVVDLEGPASLESNNSVNVAGDADSRRGYERNLMVVLPVMQGNSDLTNSNLQSLYTKPPVTAIIGEDSKDLRQEDMRTTHEDIRTTHKVIEKRIDDEPPKRETSDRHPYTEFLFSKPVAKTSKSPLDYGYPESFKFVQELNELPKNHKPEWSMPDLQESFEKVKLTTEGATKGDPFQMFESVKPLEINKLLSFRAPVVPVTDSIIEESSTRKYDTTEAPPRTKRPSQKRPTKKPQKVKLSPQKLTEADILTLTSTTTTSTTTSATTTTSTTTTTTTAPDLESEYTAARYTTLFAETTKAFLPTPYTSNEHVATHIREIAPRPTTTAPPTINHTAIIPNFQWANISSNISSTEISPAKAVSEVKPSDLVSLTKILGENFDPKVEPLKEITTKSPFPDDMLTNDMKNMLIALGILKSEGEPSMLTTEKTTTENYLFNVFGKRDEPIPPTIDPNAYISFKKMPTDFERPRDRLPVSDDMKDLLASFGLLPKRSSGFGNSILTRISRQHDLTKVKNSNSTAANSTTETSTRLNSTSDVDMLPDEMKNTLENLGLLQPLAYNYNPHRNGHVFQPTVHLEQLGNEQKVQKINEAIETIRRLSKNKDAENLSIEEIEKQLENVTALLRDENSIDANGTQPNVTLSKEIMMKIIEDAKKIPNIDQTTKLHDVKATNIETTSVEPHKVKVDSEKIPDSELSLPDLHNITIIEPEITSDDSSEEPEDLKTDNQNTSVEEMSLKPNDVEKIVEVIKKIPTTDEIPLKFPDVHYNSDESVISVVKFNSTNDNRSTELNLVMNPPNPLSPEELQQLLEFNKNDFKRQEPNDNSTISTTDASTDPSSPSTESSSSIAESSSSSTEMSTESSSLSTDTTTEAPRVESNNAPISDLADSFGGGLTASEEPPVDLQTQRPNGLYFYLDWNTFLNVGEQDKNPVRIRFSPRAGNARNFLNITVP